MDTQLFIDACYGKYRSQGITPGNPEDGTWELAHHPTPKCKGGTETLWLLKEDHAVHNLLQSEENNHPCVYGWERNYVPLEFTELAEKWISLQRSNAGKSGDPAGKAKGGEAVGNLNRLRSTNNLSSEVLSRAGRKSASLVNKQRWRCTRTGHISNPGGLSSWQNKRGIPTSCRERVS